MKTSQQCLVVADGLYMPSLSTDLCLTALFFECTARKGGLVGSFTEHSPIANAYRRELLGLMAGHSVQLGVNKFYPDLVGKVTVFSDCDGTLQKLENLPPLWIPSLCWHANILKNILINCLYLSIQVELHFPRFGLSRNMEFETLK